MTGGRYSGGVIFQMLKKQMSDAANSLIGTLCRYANCKASKSGFKSTFEWDTRYFYPPPKKKEKSPKLNWRVSCLEIAVPSEFEYVAAAVPNWYNSGLLPALLSWHKNIHPYPVQIHSSLLRPSKDVKENVAEEKIVE